MGYNWQEKRVEDVCKHWRGHNLSFMRNDLEVCVSWTNTEAHTPRLLRVSKGKLLRSLTSV